MPFLVIAGAALLIGLIVLPSLWVHHVMRRHAGDRPDFPGTGAELARHLLDEAGLTDVKVEQTDLGDHYDPLTRTVRLSDANIAGRSITAVAVAAHEVAHAVQHAEGMRLFGLRTRLATTLLWLNRAAMVVMFAAPLLAIVLRSPLLFFAQVLAALGTLALGVVVHAITLPVELDASFRKAAPVLERGRYLEGGDLTAARSVLKAAAFTYIAAALITLVDILRWIRFFR